MAPSDQVPFLKILVVGGPYQKLKPGTQLEDPALANGRLSPTSFQRFTGSHNIMATSGCDFPCSLVFDLSPK